MKSFMAILILIIGPVVLMAQITVSPWQIHEGKEGIVNHANPKNGDPSAYAKAKIPAQNDNGWKEAPKNSAGNVFIDRSSTVRCREQLDFTYFQTSVSIPANIKVDKFTVSYDKADDGARIYIFNSKFPNGTFDANADLIISNGRDNVGNVDLKAKIASGANRIVIVQFDDCADRNSLSGIHVSVNGKEVMPEKTAPTASSTSVLAVSDGVAIGGTWRLYAYSINAGQSSDKDPYCMSMNNSESRCLISSQAKLGKSGKWLDIQQITYLGGIVVFKVLNAGTDMYLTVRNNKEVHIEKAVGGKISDAAQFKMVDALTTVKNAGGRACGSFLSVKYANHYLRHSGLMLFVNASDGSDLFKQDASWFIVEESVVAASIKETKATSSSVAVTLPSEFRVYGWSSGSESYCFGMNTNDSRCRLLNTSRMGNDAKLMDIQRIDLGGGICAFKVLNAGTDMYMTVRDNKEVHIERAVGGKVSDAAKYRCVASLYSGKASGKRSSCSFVSVKYADYYLCQQGFAISCQASNGSEAFYQNASWLIEAGLAVVSTSKGTATASSETVALPDKFRVHAFSISEGKGDKDSYWFALNNNDSRGRILSQAKLGSNAKWMEIQQVSLGNGIYAFKVTNSGSDMYLTARDNKEVHVEKATGGNVSEGAKFRSVKALTSAKGASDRNFCSFVSVKFANHYLRHEHFAMFVHESNGSELFKQDASWRIEEGFAKATSTGASSAAVALPDKFKVLAFSISEGKGDKDSYWFATNNNDSRGRILSQAKLGSNAKWMEIQRVELGNDIYAFKVTNAGADMYLTARDNKEVHVEKATGGNVPDGAKFKSVKPLTSAPGANERNFRSFQSVKFANHYLRHSGFAMFVHDSNGSELFKQDASWLIEKM